MNCSSDWEKLLNFEDEKTVNQFYNYSAVFGAAIKCKPYSEITVESGTQLKTVHICSVSKQTNSDRFISSISLVP